MRRAVSVGVRACAGLSLAVWAAGVCAQSIDVPRGIDQLLRALQAPERGAGGASETATPRSGSIDTSENLEAVVQGARERIRNTVSGGGAEDACQGAASPLRPGKLQGSGWMELVAKCTAVLEQDQRTKDEAAAAQERQRAETERTQKAQASKQANDYEARRQALLAGLRSGKTAPQNCAQWMLTRGMERDALQANEVTRIAYRPPQGAGYFEGVVQQIQGEKILVRMNDHLVVVAVGKSSQMYRDSDISENSRIGVVGHQSGSRALRRADGSANTVAVVTPSCVVGAPNWLMDLMPQ